MELGYAPSIDWYVRWMGSLICGTPPPRPGRMPNRCTISDGARTQLLTVPIEGGGKLGKRGLPSQLSISDHGRWRDIHLGALQAAYGKAPFYEHYIEEITQILRGQWSTLGELDEALHDFVCRKIHLAELLPIIIGDPTAGVLAAKADDAVDPSLSALHLLFTRGPETILTLLQRFNNSK